jgi:hypothetical protein
VALNGSTSPAPLELNAGVRHRVRVISLTRDEDADLSWFAFADRTDSTRVSWRAIGKDGAALPERMATMRTAKLHIAPGETYDFEITPRPGDTRIHVTSKNTSLIRVIARE